MALLIMICKFPVLNRGDSFALKAFPFVTQYKHKYNDAQKQCRNTYHIRNKCRFDQLRTYGRYQSKYNNTCHQSKENGSSPACNIPYFYFHVIPLILFN